MDKILNGKVLTKELMIELLKEAKQDEAGNFYLEGRKKSKGSKFETDGSRIYFGMFYTLISDFVEEYTHEDVDKNTIHYNRHFTYNDDTVKIVLVKNAESEENKI